MPWGAGETPAFPVLRAVVVREVAMGYVAYVAGSTASPAPRALFGAGAAVRGLALRASPSAMNGLACSAGYLFRGLGGYRTYADSCGFVDVGGYAG